MSDTFEPCELRELTVDSANTKPELKSMEWHCRLDSGLLQVNRGSVCP